MNIVPKEMKFNGRKFKNTRETANLTQEELCDLINKKNCKISSKTISGWENIKNSNPKFSILKIACECLNISPNVLYETKSNKEKVEEAIYIEYPLDKNILVKIEVPSDINKIEAERLKVFISTLFFK